MMIPSPRFILAVCLPLVFACNKLVNESYATRGDDSINGVDAFHALVEDRSGEMLDSTHLTRRVRERADVVVFFDKGNTTDRSFLRDFEAYLFDRTPESLDPDADLEDEEEEFFDEIEAEKPKTILYFLRDTDASLSFWEVIVSQMGDHPDELEFAQQNYRERLQQRSAVNFSSSDIPFGTMEMMNAAGPLRRNLVYAPGFGARINRYPVRRAPSDPYSHFDLVGFDWWPLVRTTDGVHLIREFRFPKARVIVVYNSEPFLNHSMVRDENRAFAGQFLSYALSGTASGQAVTAYITDRPVPIRRSRNRPNRNPWRVLLVYPINILFLHFIAFLALFLLARWPHERPPLRRRQPGTREFLEHIRALGAKLSRVRHKHEGLEPLIHYRRVTGNEITNGDEPSPENRSSNQ